jgi:hypothetical protein
MKLHPNEDKEARALLSAFPNILMMRAQSARLMPSPRIARAACPGLSVAEVLRCWVKTSKIPA